MPPHPKSLPCPAKINLFLEVRGKRPDGYHELGTLFQALELGDRLHAEPWDGIEVEGGGVPGRPEDNLVHKAARLLQTRFSDRIGPAGGIRFRLEKRIPMGGGLGGGSSDAAAALRLANEIWELGLDRKQLLALAPELGSDVAFFLFQSTAFAEGRGEILSPAPKPYAFHVVVATPPFQVETARAYRGLGPLAGSRWNGFKARYAAESQNPSLYSGLHNDFEEPMERLFPEIRTLRESLASFGPEKAMLTGSGSSLFALFRDPGNAKACLEAVAPRCRFSAMTRFLF